MGTNKKKQNEVADMLVLILQIGITMLVPIMMCTIGGAWLDNKLDTKFIGVLGFVLGAIAGFQKCIQTGEKIFKEYQVTRRDTARNG